MDILIGFANMVWAVLCYVLIGILITYLHYKIFVLPNMKNDKCVYTYYDKDYWLEYILVWPLILVSMIFYGIESVIKYFINWFTYDR